jgi:hypothetical protein
MKRIINNIAVFARRNISINTEEGDLNITSEERAALGSLA